MAASSFVEDTIDQAWDLANSAVEDAESYAKEATREANSRITHSFVPVNLEIPDRDLVELTKLEDIRAEVDKILGSDVPATKKRLFDDLLKQSTGLKTIFDEEGTWDASDSIVLVSTLSDAFNTAFSGDNGSISDMYKDTAAYFLNGTIYDENGDLQSAKFGLPDDVEARMRNRSFDTLSREAVRDEMELIAAHASRGFPMPTGAINHGIDSVREKAQQEKSKVITEVWIDQQKLAYESTFKYLELFADQQKTVQTLFLDYLSQVIKARESTSDDMQFLIDAIVKLRTAMTQFYTQLYDDRGIYLKEAIAEQELSISQSQIRSSDFQARLNAGVQAASSSASVMGSLASSAVGSQNTMASVAEETIKEQSSESAS